MRKSGLVSIIAAMALVFASGVAMAVTITGGPADDTIDIQDLGSSGIVERDVVDCGRLRGRVPPLLGSGSRRVLA